MTPQTLTRNEAADDLRQILDHPNGDLLDAALAEERRRYREALIWMSGSDHFSPGGMAHEGFLKIVKPLLDETDVTP